MILNMSFEYKTKIELGQMLIYTHTGTHFRIQICQF